MGFTTDQVAYLKDLITQKTVDLQQRKNKALETIERELIFDKSTIPEHVFKKIVSEKRKLIASQEQIFRNAFDKLKDLEAQISA